MIAADIIKETEIFIEKSKIDGANWLSSILPLKSLRNLSVTLKQSNWRNIAVSPQIIISKIELLTESELASGIPIPNKAPEKEIADFSLKIFNQDGSEAENCVNGMRCVARYLSDRNISISDTVKLLIGANQVTVEKRKNDYIVENIFSLSPSEIGLNKNEQVFEIEFDDKKVPCFAVSIGNPHAVIFNDELALDVQKFGTFLQESDFFKNGVNVGFIQMKNAKEINLRVFERGVGETQACGSGACAAAVACAIQKELDQELKINFHQGQVFTKVNLDDSKVMLQGRAEYRKQDVLLNL